MPPSQGGHILSTAATSGRGHVPGPGQSPARSIGGVSIVGSFLHCVAPRVQLCELGLEVKDYQSAYPPARAFGGRLGCGSELWGTPQVACARCLLSPSFEQMYIYFYSNGKSNWIVS